jgi:zinc transporter 2
MILEIIGGFWANSLAIMTDAAHLLSDIAGFLISITAIWLGTFPVSERLTYGWHRAEILCAMLSVFLIWALTGVLVYEAILRTIAILGPNPPQLTDGKIMTIVASIGLVVNVLLLKVLGHSHSHGPGGGHGHSHSPTASDSAEPADHGHSHTDHGHAHDDSNNNHNHSNNNNDNSYAHSYQNDDEIDEGLPAAAEMKLHGHAHHATAVDSDTENELSTAEAIQNINVRAAYIHAIGDLLQSAGVCIAGALIMYNPKWQLADPIATFFFSIMVLATTVDIMRNSIRVLMEGTPDGIHPEKIEASLRVIPSVTAVHDLHIWSLTVGNLAASVHVGSTAAQSDQTLHLAEQVLRKYGIVHTTIQVEHSDGQNQLDCSPCCQAYNSNQ